MTVISSPAIGSRSRWWLFWLLAAAVITVAGVREDQPYLEPAPDARRRGRNVARNGWRITGGLLAGPILYDTGQQASEVEGDLDAVQMKRNPGEKR